MQELGADEVVDYTRQSVDQVYKDNPFDAVIDQIGGDHLYTNFTRLFRFAKHNDCQPLRDAEQRQL